MRGADAVIQHHSGVDFALAVSPRPPQAGGPALEDRPYARPSPRPSRICRTTPNDPRTTRDQIFAELRNVAEQCERLAHRTNLVAVKLAQLPIRGEGE
jgi:hypothetical protein